MPELRFGYTLFTGSNELDHIGAISEVIGLPPVEMSKQSKKTDYFDPITHDLMFVVNEHNETRVPNSKPLEKIIRKRSDTKFRSLVQSLLVWNPDDRPNPSQARQHPFFSERDTFSFF